MNKLNIFAYRSVSMRLGMFVLMLLMTTIINAQTNTITYQGRLSETSSPNGANGTYQMTFGLFSTETGGAAIQTITDNAVTVTNGVFTVPLNFNAPNAFDGGARFIEISVKKTSEQTFTTLTPRQAITSAPYSIRTLNAGTADTLSATCVSCVTNNQIASLDGAKVTGTVANANTATNATNATNATTATTAGNVTGVVAIANGGTGSSTQNFVDLTTAQTIAGNKTLNGLTTLNGGARIQNLAADPEAASAANAGRVYYNTAIGRLRFSNGTTWITAGQPTIYHVYATAGRLAVANNVAVVQPGMSQTITVPSGFTANVVISANIGGRTTVTTTGAYAIVDAFISLNNTFLPKGAYNRFSIVNPTTFNAFNSTAINSAISVGAGTHTFELRTARNSGTSTVDIGGNSASDANPGEMTLTVYYTPITFVNRPGNGELENETPVVIETEKVDSNAPMTNKRAIFKEVKQND